ncbi:DNA-binding transcriptional regulator, MarR family [Nonomuraea solani]|uniref:DNA-binding transcriptional regulator, MarR family n=1 Tax=Nonomuraea solani TaxID=1144553 RepID=A0A1H5Z5K8_9ACTN|nr:MarR family transcriptional regulator [Nonomuraea solani]SEG31813.1 DNA-binding transcriptional regulator, MarR family [Nonomuraea solani]
MSRRRLGYLLKHAGLRLGELTGPALEPYGIDGREFAVLSVLGAREPLSQLEAAQRLGIDRTTMVAMVDALERKGLVGRRPHPGDRRKNIVEPTERGREVLGAATRAVEEAEEAFLAVLPDQDAQRLREALDRLV